MSTIADAPARRFLKAPSNKTVLAVAVLIYLVVSWLILRAFDVTAIRPRIDLSPILSAPLVLQLHVAGALSAFGIGLWLIGRPGKSRRLHKTLGWSWVTAMFVTAVSSFFLTGLNGASLSWIHGLSAWIMIALPMGVAAIRRRDVKSHAKAMRNMFMGGIAIAGLFSFLPGRMMFDLFFAVAN